MRKSLIKLLTVLCAIFAYQNVSAQEELFNESLFFGIESFHVEGDNGINDDLWSFTFMQHYVVADGYTKIDGPIESRLVANKTIKLKENNVVSFSSHTSSFNDVAKEISVSVRVGQDAWTDLPLSVQENTNEFVAQLVNIPAEFNNKEIELGFKYTAQSSDMAGKWAFKEIVVTANAGAPVDKVDAGIAYDVTEYNYKVGEQFIAPVLSNPNNLTVTYSSSNEAVASIDALGYVTVNGEGTTTIKAVSAETAKYYAGEASYVLTVSQTGEGGGTGNVAENLFEATFDYDECGFVVEGFNGDDNNIWQWRKDAQDMYADGFYKINGALENYLVSPEIYFGTENVISFSSYASIFSNVATDIAISIREVGGAWTDFALPISDNSGSNVLQEFKVPEEFNGKKVQIGFKYTAASSYSCGMWYIDNVVVKGVKGSDVPAEKKDPQISYNVGDVEATMGQPFEAPVLNNPNNVEIVYSSKNANVATVDPQTGAVTLVGEGFTTITATSVENEEFKSVFANYVLTVKSAEAANIIFEENFEVSLGDFMIEDPLGETSNPIWINTSGYAKADGYYKVSGETTSYLVSPVITLDAAGNEVEFGYYLSNYDTDNNVENQIGLSIRTVGGEWENIPLSEYAAGKETICIMTVPSAYAGKDVQFGFRYTARSSMLASVWNVDNLIVRRTAAAPVEKKDAELSFAEETHDFYFNKSQFEGVTLNNPNNLEVVYSIIDNDFTVADVEPTTGIVWVYDYGKVVITASSEETDEFKAGSASYTLVVTDIPTSIEGITADELENGQIYDLQGRKVTKLTKGVFVVNGKKVIIK